MLCNVCLSSRGAQDIIDDKPQFSRPFLVAWDLRCFGTADAMSGCNETAAAQLIEARKLEVKQLRGHTVRKALSGSLEGDGNDRPHRGGRWNL